MIAPGTKVANKLEDESFLFCALSDNLNISIDIVKARRDKEFESAYLHRVCSIGQDYSLGRGNGAFSS